MAFPAIGSTATTNGVTATTAPVVNLPSGIVAGQTLIVLIRVASAGAIGWPAGWTELFDDASDASNDQTACAWRKADGTEGATITLSSANAKFAAIAFRITGATDPTVTAPVFATLATGTSANPDPGSLTPAGGAKDYLWLAVGGWEGEQTSPPGTFPANYTLSQIGADSGVAGSIATNCRVAGAGRQLNAATENPGTYTISVSDDWTATTIAVYPGPSVVEKTHTTDSLLKATSSKDHQTNSLLKATAEKTHTTDSLLKATSSKTHTTDSLLKATTDKTHSTDSLIKATISKVHTTDSFLSSGVDLTHTTGSLLKATTSKTQTSDSLLKATTDKNHLTDSLLKATVAKAHPTDSLLRATVDKTQTADSLLKATSSKTQSTDSLLKATTSRTHGADSLLKATSAKAHPTDSLLKATIGKTQTADSLLKATTSQTHQSDTLLKATGQVSHGTDSRLAQILDRTHSTDSLLETEVTTLAGMPFLYTAANYAGYEWCLEVYFRAASGTVDAELYDETTGYAVENSRLSTSSPTLVRLRTGKVDLRDGHEYTLRLRRGSLSAGRMRSACLIGTGEV